MPSLLVSVRSAKEAQIALEGGANVIDIKNPDAPPLGMAQPDVIRGIVQTVGGALPVSAALGELHEWNDQSTFQVDPGVNFYKLGLSRMAADNRWEKRLQDFIVKRFIPRSQFIAVAYADGERVDAPPPDAILDAASRHGWRGLLIDTYKKDGTWTGDYLDAPDLKRLSEKCRRHDLLFALAGALTMERMERLTGIRADLFAVRGAACLEGSRTRGIQLEAVEQLARVLARRDNPF